MLVDFGAKIVDLSGKDIPVQMDGGETEPLTLERVAVSALLQTPDRMSGDEKYSRYTLMKRIHGVKEPLEIKAEDVAVIKRVIGESQYTPLVTGQAWDLLEGKQASKPEVVPEIKPEVPSDG